MIGSAEKASESTFDQKLSNFKPAQCVNKQVVIFDSELSFNCDTFYRLKNIARVSGLLLSEVLLQAFIGSGLV